MTERIIQNWLWRYLDLRGHKNICPNYRPEGWWECDMFSTTRDGFMVEHEIKVTVADFKRDLAKRAYRRTDPMAPGREMCMKHAELEAGKTTGPTRFFYVVPSGMIDRDDVPKWAGLIYADDLKRAVRPVDKIAFHETLSAPRLHNQRPADHVLTHVQTVYYWRFWKERRRP